MSFIEVKRLRKEFRGFRHREGVWDAFKDLFQRQYQSLAAVDAITFKIDNGACSEPGEWKKGSVEQSRVNPDRA